MPNHRKPRQSKRSSNAGEHATHGEEDRRIAEGALAAIRWLTTVPEDRIKIAVHSGELTLSGKVENLSQKSVAEAIVEKQPGVKKVRNRLEVNEEAKASTSALEPLWVSHWQTDFFAQLYDGSD